MITTSTFQIFLITVTLHLLLDIIPESISINLAMKGKYCSGKNLSNVMFDGLKTSVESMIGSCTDSWHAYVIVELAGSCNIFYVVVFQGESGNEFEGQLDFFTVDMIRQDMTALCSEYPTLSRLSEKGMQVNCAQFLGVFSKVKVNSRHNEGLFISEIEVHTLESNEKIAIFRGCSSNFQLIGKGFSENLFENCYIECSRDNYTFFALKRNTSCYCAHYFEEEGNAYDDISMFLPEVCHFTCSDGIHSCGGIKEYSIYLIRIQLPRYVGCFFRSIFNLGITVLKSNAMTVTDCIKHCDDYSYAMLQKGEYCACTYELPATYDPSDYNKCDSKCPGNDSYYCGGVDYLSIYETCRESLLTYHTCINLFRCEGSDYDMFGRCLSKCEFNFNSEYCLSQSLQYLNKTLGLSKGSPTHKYYDNVNKISFMVIIILMFPV